MSDAFCAAGTHAEFATYGAMRSSKMISFAMSFGPSALMIWFATSRASP